MSRMKRSMLLKTAVITFGFISSISTSFADFGLVTDSAWNNTAVRKVLHTFAYGGFATDAQIQAWADMPPQAAIAQILTFTATNDLLSPPEADNLQAQILLYGKDRTLQALQGIWMANKPENGHVTNRAFFDLLSSGLDFRVDGLKYTWMAATNKRGLNPFRQRVGFWLTNYLMSVHADATESFVPVRTLYDESMDLLGQNTGFAAVLADGAASAAIAIQYGHTANKYNKATGKFSGNDDFAREFHQLFFGINGVLAGYEENSPEAVVYKKYYEDKTVAKTAYALTGMKVSPLQGYANRNSVPSDQIDFQSLENIKFHFAGPLEILNFSNQGLTNVNGATAEAKLANLAQIAINDPESELNLPIMIASYFADDTLDDGSVQSEATKSTLRSGWLASGKNLLSFLRAYAISPEFHSINRIKFMNSIERNIRVYNQNTVDNQESYLNHQPQSSLLRILFQDADLFRPKRAVFGGQTGIEASNNSQVFKAAYNYNVNDPTFLDRNRLPAAQSSPPIWLKDWAKIIPKNSNGQYVVADVGRWLWNRFIGDGGKNYGPQEKAYIEAFLATGKDLLTQINPTTPKLSGYSDAELLTNPQASIVTSNSSTLMQLDSASPTQRQDANRWVGLAVNFITVTPFMFAQEGL